MKIIIKIFSFFILAIAFSNCQRDKFMDAANVELQFSADTITFDTIFTQVGSVTKRLMVYNPHNEKVKIDKIYLKNQNQSDFRINIDGNKDFAHDVIIQPHDSLFIFIAVTLTEGKNFILEQDNILFETGAKTKMVDLLAWGRDVYRINSLDINQDTVLKNDKPYLVFDKIHILPNVKVTIPAATKFYFMQNASFFCEGTLIANGMQDSMIEFKSARLEKLYDDVPAQWSGITIQSTSQNCKLNYVDIFHAITALDIQPKGSDYAKIEIANCKIMHHSYAGIISNACDVYTYNTLIANCGNYAWKINGGGNINVAHLTIANYYAYDTRFNPSLYLSNKPMNATLQRNLNVKFTNAIIYGNNQNELVIDTDNTTTVSYLFSHAIVKTNSAITNTSNPLNFVNIENIDPEFADTENSIFDLKNTSPAINKGESVTAQLFPLDYYNKSRISDVAADLGFAEFISK